MILTLDLHDGEGKSHQKNYCPIGDEATKSELEKKVLKILKIEPAYQQLFHKDTQILDGNWGEIELKEGDTIIVKHSELPWWSKYKNSVDIAMKSGPERIEYAKEAVKLHKRLMKNEFFYVYCSFNIFREENHRKAVYWADENIPLMKEATLSHFRDQHFKLGAEDESEFICRFEARPEGLGGSRTNTLAYIKLHGEKEETKYNVKSHHFASSVDIEELFCYKLLELINVCPNVQFIFPNEQVTTSRNKNSMYIATKWNDDFVPIYSIGEEDVSIEVLVQILLLGTFLFMGDLSSENCGQWKGTKDAAVVDFMPIGYTRFTNVKKALLNNNLSEGWEKIHIEALKKCSEKSRLEMAKEYLKKWDLLTKIDKSIEQLKPEMDCMELRDIGFKGFNSPNEKLDEYISVIKQNLVNLIDMLNVGE